MSQVSWFLDYLWWETWIFSSIFILSLIFFSLHIVILLFVFCVFISFICFILQERRIIINLIFTSQSWIWGRSILETLIERKKLLVNSIFLFSQNVFYSDKGKNLCFEENLILHAKVFKFNKALVLRCGTELTWHHSFNPLLHMPILGSSNSAENKDIMSKIWTNEDTIIWLSRKHCGKRRNCSLRAISPFTTMFSKAVCYWYVKMSIYGLKG